MGKVLGVVVGAVLVILGVWGIVTWWSLFVRGLMAAVPPLMIVVGAVLAVFFISEIRSSMREKAEMAATSETEPKEEETGAKEESEKKS
jgi:predicted RND superfamily exporter protein